MLSSDGPRFRHPQAYTSQDEQGQPVQHIAFASRKEADQWLEEQKAKGIDIALIGKGERGVRFMGTAHKQIKLGGDEEGLRAIAYIVQTFFAQAFPDIARLPALDPLKAYTLNNVGKGFAWWDFAPPTDLPANAFPFGHRVVVGLDQAAGTAYARISFYSTLNFAVLLANVPVTTSRAVVTDIDPLAKSPPRDIVSWNAEAALGAVARPANLTAALGEAIRSGRAEAQIRSLMGRIQVFENDMAAARLLAQAEGAAALPDTEREALFTRLITSEAQRVLNLMRTSIADCKLRASNPVEKAVVAFMEKVVELDPQAINGLTPEAARSIETACQALARQMSADCKAGLLDRARMGVLIGGGPGAFAVLEPLKEAYLKTLRP
ncbi:hypothetical protein MKL09_05110 [Methylobacterium sp. J-048]|nr:hypothetical protein [Methylobacterium sp. J-048]